MSHPSRSSGDQAWPITMHWGLWDVGPGLVRSSSARSLEAARAADDCVANGVSGSGGTVFSEGKTW